MILVESSLASARENLWKHQTRFNYFPDINIVINGSFGFNFNSKQIYSNLEDPKSPFLACYIEPTILQDILHRKIHWNNAEIGCLIRFNRQPNIYMPDVHTLMSFFHL